jgi:hypothetical protein
MTPRARAAAAGSVAATAWALAEPFDRRLFGFAHSDVALLGKAFARGRLWRPLGLALHAANGAVAGVAFDALDRRVCGSRRLNAVTFALAEHVLLYPLSHLTDRFHPARGAPDLPPLARSPRGFGQAAFRHLLFGLVLGALAGPREPRS